jgi:hypothetical protein
LEERRRFLDWFVWHRFYATLTSEELETCASGGGLPDPIPNRPSSVDSLDRKSLLKLWEEDEAIFRGRSHEELDFYTENASWPEQRGRLHYSKQDGKMVVEWRNDLTEQGAAPLLERPSQGPTNDCRSHFGGPKWNYHDKSKRERAGKSGLLWN